MRIMGIDPGTRIAGYGVVDLKSNRILGVAAGAWKLDAKLPLAGRLAALAVEFRRALDVYAPQAVCVELAFVAENVRSALFLGHARGVILAEAHLRGLAIHEISATAAKKSIVNFGRADKETIARTLSTLLGVDFGALPHDASDALGLAYAHALKERFDAARCDAPSRPDPERDALLAAWTRGGRTSRGSGKTKAAVGFEILLSHPDKGVK